MKKIVLFSNCAGNILKNMFEKHSFTKDKYLIHYITNYENLNKQHIDDSHISLLTNCDIFIYQPLNQHYTTSEYDITNIKNICMIKQLYLKLTITVLKDFGIILNINHMIIIIIINF